MPKNNFVSVIVPVYNGEKTIGKCIDALLKQDYKNYEVIVINDGSTDNTEKTVSKYKDKVKLFSQKNKGPASARNLGVKKSLGKIIVFTDADCMVPKDWLRKIISPLLGKNEIAAVGGTYRTINKESIIARWVGYEIAYRHRKNFERDFVASFSAAFRKNIFEKVNGFNESFRYASGEDNDICYKIRELGYKIILNPDVWVWHHHPESLIGYLGGQFRHAKWRIKLYLMYPKKIAGDKYTGPLFILHPLIYSLLLLSLLLTPVSALPFLVFLTLSLIIHLPFVKFVLSASKNPKDAFILMFCFLRDFAWIFGMFAGLKFLLERFKKV